MVAPIDYTIDVKTPFESSLQGYQAGAAIRDDQLKQQQQQTALQLQQQQAQVIRSLVSNPNATATDYSNATLLVPGMREQLDQSWKTRNQDQQQSQLADLSKYYAAISAGKPELAAQLMNEKADAMQASGGSPADIQALRTHAGIIDAHPELGRTMMGMVLSSIPGGDKVITGANSIGEESRKQQQAPAELAVKNAEAGIKTAEAGVAPQKVQADLNNVLSQITDRGARLGLDRDKLTTETQLKLYELKQQYGQLPTEVAKNLNDSATQAIASQQTADQINTLADKLEASGAASGTRATVAEAFKSVVGSQDEVTALRQEYARVRSGGVSKMLPPGPASDKDIQIAMAGFPKDTSSPEQLASFLRGMAKLQTYDAILNNAKSQWFGEVRNLGKAKSDIEIDGVKVPAGTTFNEFANKVVAQKAQQADAAKVVNDLAKKYGATAPAQGVTGGY